MKTNCKKELPQKKTAFFKEIDPKGFKKNGKK
jgi:hypothetical protein